MGTAGGYGALGPWALAPLGPGGVAKGGGVWFLGGAWGEGYALLQPRAHSAAIGSIVAETQDAQAMALAQ